ncbi:MAG: DUF1015 domain-containing protein [Crocinitomicaceae bacterium]|nr:DUF1015 domain-containing protein [Crocinitomicaceae bacterium]
MAKIRPFRAIRPQRDKVHLVATRPFYTYKKNVLKAKMEDNPFTFLHIINPEFNHSIKTKPNSKERFQLVKSGYDNFLKSGVLIKEKEAALYIYRQTTATAIFTGVIGGASVAEYQDGSIKKHEATLTARETMFTNYLEEVGFNAEPVLLSYKGNEELNSSIKACISSRPEYEFTTTDQIKHELWVINEQDTQKIQGAFEKITCIYIADGHHRSASSSKLQINRTNSNSPVLGASDFLAYFVEEEILSIKEFNRLITSLAGYTKTTFLHVLAAIGNVQGLDKGRKPLHEHEICFYLENEWYSLVLFDYLIDEEHPVKSLDCDILTEFILKPILGIEDLRTSDQVDFLPGTESLEKITSLVDAGKFAVGFILFPITITQLKKVADNQLNMPPKSTYIEPKLRSGLTIYDINE